MATDTSPTPSETGEPATQGRSALLEATIEAMATSGPGGVRPSEICEALGLSKSLVNFHFGSRDRLIAEALATSYERYVDELERAANGAGTDPMARLTAWMHRQVEWTIEHPGIAVGLNFPRESAVQLKDVDDPVYERLNRAGARNFRNLTALTRAVMLAARGDTTDGAQLDPSEVALDAAITGWVTLGMSVWAAGNHLPTQQLGAQKFLPIALERITTMLRSQLGA